MEDKNFLKEIFNENEQKCTDLFGTESWYGKLQDGSRNKMRVYVDYIKFVQEVLKLYKADVADWAKDILLRALLLSYHRKNSRT